MLFRSVPCCRPRGGHAPVIPTATAPRSCQGTAVPTGRPWCRAAHVGAHARRVSAHLAPGLAPGRAPICTRLGMLVHGALCGAVSACHGRGGCVSVCVRVRLRTGRTVAHGGAPVVWDCGHAVVNRDGRVSARPLRVSCVGVGVWVPTCLFGGAPNAVQPPESVGRGRIFETFF